MEEMVGKILVIFNEHGIGMSSAFWPWPDGWTDTLDAGGVNYAVLDNDTPDKYWMDIEGDRQVYIREPVEFSSNKLKVASDGIDEVTITELPENCVVLVNNTPHTVENGSLSITVEDQGEFVVRLGGKYISNFISINAHNISDYKNSKRIEIDTIAEEKRNKVITPGSGQAMTYLRKAEAAKTFLAGMPLEAPQMARITDEAERLGVTTQQAAQSILDIAEAWEAMDRLVDKTRLDAKKAIDEAETLDDIDLVMQTLEWP